MNREMTACSVSIMAVADAVDARCAPFCLIVYWLLHLAGGYQIIVNVGSELVLIFRGVLVISSILWRVSIYNRSCYVAYFIAFSVLKIKSDRRISCLPSPFTG